MSNAPDNGAPRTPPQLDRRLYVPLPDGWEARVKQTWEKEYCYLQNPGEDYFHTLVAGEIFIQRGHEKYCLNCAYRAGLVTSDRLYWQHLPDENRRESR